jgi:F-type H+-transporting ATPase subunit c
VHGHTRLQAAHGSLSTTAALALCVFIAVPIFGIREQGWGGYLKTYTTPTFIMLPFNIISELSRTLALAVRLFGNMMSGVMIIAILLTITPFHLSDRHDGARPAHRAWSRPTSSASWPRSTSRPQPACAKKPRPTAKARPPTKLTTSATKGLQMDSITLVAVTSIATAGITTGIGCMCPALGEGKAVATALTSLAQQPDASATITRTLFVGLAMIESTAIYCFVVSMILIFANPFWTHVIAKVAGK